MTHDEIKYRALEYCNQKAEKGRSFNPLTVNDLVKFAELCSESANSLSLIEQVEISAMKREKQIDEIVKHLEGLYEHAENRDYRYSISALLRMAIAWADENPEVKRSTVDPFDRLTLTFDVNFPGFVKEACENCQGGMYAITWNILKNLICQVAQRATELHDPVLDALMIKLNLYEIPNSERRKMIKILEQNYKEQIEIDYGESKNN